MRSWRSSVRPPANPRRDWRDAATEEEGPQETLNTNAVCNRCVAIENARAAQLHAAARVTPAANSFGTSSGLGATRARRRSSRRGDFGPPFDLALQRRPVGNVTPL